MSLSVILSVSVSILGEILGYLILVRCLISYFPFSRQNIFVTIIYNLTEPLLAPARNLLARLFNGRMMLDFSPILVWLLLDYFIVPAVIYFIQFIFR